MLSKFLIPFENTKFPFPSIYQEPKSTVKDENGSASKNNAPAKGVPPAPSSKGGSSPIVSGPVSEEEIRAVLMQKTPLTTQDLVAKFRARLRSPEVSSTKNFAFPLLSCNFCLVILMSVYAGFSACFVILIEGLLAKSV